MSTYNRRLAVYDASRNRFSCFRSSKGVALLKNSGVDVVDSYKQANIVVGETRSDLLRSLLKGGDWRKTSFLFTDEPSYDQNTETRASLVWGLNRYHVMNVFTGEVFVDEAGFIGVFGLNAPVPEFDEGDLRRRFQTKRGAAFITYRQPHQTRRLVGGRDVDLNAYRIQLALAGQKRGVVDIYGSGFPAGLAMAATGWGNTQPGEEWWDVKHRVLCRDYCFNLCLENTDWPNYITEKLWQSIRAGCLPVYYGKNNGIRRLLPADSYIEATDYSSADEIYDHLLSMSFDEYMARLIKCREAYCKLVNRFNAGETDSFEARMTRLAARLHQAVDGKVVKPIGG